MRKIYAGLFALALAIAAPAYAQEPGDPVEEPVTSARVPNFLGTTGLLALPSAYTQANGGAAVFIGGTSDFFGGGATVGLGNRFEVGFSVIDFDEGDDTEFPINAKFQLLAEDENRPAIAVGVIDIFDTLDVDPTWYVVASKYFTRSEIEQRFALKGHVGFGGGLFDEEFFLGGELFFNPQLSLMAEFHDDAFNVGGRWTSNGFAVTLGLFDLDRFGGQVAYITTFR